MQALDLPCKPPLDPSLTDPSVMSEQKSSPICSYDAENSEAFVGSSSKNESSGRKKNSSKNNGDSTSSNVVFKRERPSRACTQRAAERMQAAARAEAEMEAERKRKKSSRKQKLASRLLKEDSEFDDEEEGFDDVGDEDNANDEDDGGATTSSTITPLVGDLEDSQLPRWNIRSMWELASIFNFLNVFRPLLNINVEFSAEELETALLTPNNTLADVHMPLLKAIPPIIRMALGPSTWITVLCRKLRHWWHWVAEGDLPIVASHGAEIEAYNALDPGVRVAILKALCDIRVEQEDIKIFIDDSVKNGAQLSLFRKQRIGGDSRGVSYWYEDDPIIGHRLYREIRKVEAKKSKGKNVPQIAHSSYQWEAVATNLDEFLNVSDKLFNSKNRTEVSVGKKLKNDMIPEIEKVHKRKERLLKKQHREALMLDSIMHIDGLGGGRSLRDRKPVTYTFDDYDRSINEALKFTKYLSFWNRQQSPEPHERRELRTENSLNGGWAGTLRSTRQDNFSAPSPMSDNDDLMLEDHETEVFDDRKDESLDRSNRRRQRPQRYAENDFVEDVWDHEADPESDDDIVGEVVYDEEYLRKRKRRRRVSSSEEGDEEYKWDEEENHEEEEDDEEEEGNNNNLSTSEEEDSDEQPRKLRKRTRRETRLRSVKETQKGLRRSKRSTRNRVNYKLYEMSESDNELMKTEEKSIAEQSYASGNYGGEEEEDPYAFSAMQDFEEEEEEIDDQKERHIEHNIDQPTEESKLIETVECNNKEETDNENPPNGDGDDDDDDDQEDDGLRKKRRFLDLNELAPGTLFDDGPTSTRDDDGPSGF